MMEDLSTPVVAEVAAAPAVEPEHGSGDNIPPVKAPKAIKAAPPPKPEAPAAPEIFEHKVNGQIRRYTREQLLAKASLGEAATERFEEASRMAKKAQARDEAIKKDFLTALQDPELGLSRDQIRARFESWYKEEFIDPETLSPEQRELNELKKYKSQVEEERKSQAELTQKTEHEKAVDAARESLQHEIIKTLDSSNLPKNRFTVARLAYWQKQNLDRGYDAPPEVLIQQVKEERSGIIRADLKEATIEQIQDTLGEDFEAFITKVRKYDLARLQTKFGEKPEPRPRDTDGTYKRVLMSDVDRYFTNLRRS